MNYLKTAHRILRLCLTLVVGALSLLTIVGCGIFSNDAARTPAPTAAPTAQSAAAVGQSSASGSVDKTSAEDSDLYRAVWTDGTLTHSRSFSRKARTPMRMTKKVTRSCTKPYGGAISKSCRFSSTPACGRKRQGLRTATRCCTRRYGGATMNSCGSS